jgi:hypothetical protein
MCVKHFGDTIKPIINGMFYRGPEW